MQTFFKNIITRRKTTTVKKLMQIYSTIGNLLGFAIVAVCGVIAYVYIKENSNIQIKTFIFGLHTQFIRIFPVLEKKIQTVCVSIVFPQMRMPYVGLANILLGRPFRQIESEIVDRYHCSILTK